MPLAEMAATASLTASTLAIFLLFAWAIRSHFRSVKTPAGIHLISVLGVLTVAATLVALWSSPPAPAWAALGLGAQVAGATLFAAALRATRQQRLSLAFDNDVPAFLVASGPYRWVRHPFYAAYTVFWIGCAAASRSTWALIGGATLLACYIAAALREEAKFEASTLRETYRDYRRRAGFMWPNLFRRDTAV